MGNPPDEASRRASAPAISLPKGGGAVRGVGEKFVASPFTGTGSLTVPLAASQGRSGFGPQLSLAYDSAAGNGPFGFGWQLSLPRVTRKTDKGLPRYGDPSQPDVFILSGAEDLVPVTGDDGLPLDGDMPVGADTYTVRRYRPRVEGPFARIERWTRRGDGDVHWRSFSGDNVLTLYGADPSARITDPDDLSRVFEWLASESRDDRGNAVRYSYQAENGQGIEAVAAHERNRTPAVRATNRYLKRIVYGNRQPLLDEHGERPTFLSAAALAAAEWLFEVVFDYDEGHYELLALDAQHPEADQHRFALAADAGPRSWPARPDPFSSYRATFEVRTYRRCHRVLVFHRFDELGPEPYLVRATEFNYADLDGATHPSVEDELAHQGSTRLASFIQGITQWGYVRDDSRSALVRDGVTYRTYVAKAMPPLEFTYSKARVQDAVHEVDAASVENLPAGLDESRRWVDLDGEGLAGLLSEEMDAWFYKPNLGQGTFGAMRAVRARPSLAHTAPQLLDLSGEGRLDAVDLSGPTPGFYARTADEDWDRFRPFHLLPVLTWDDRDLHFVDLTGDGLADVLTTGDDELCWYQSLGSEGFDLARHGLVGADEERRPRLVAAGATESIYLADMSGDGLADVVRVRRGEICYWPSLGYGRFGPKVTMDDAPVLDGPDEFDPGRVRLADIDGSGTHDVIYLGRRGVRVFFNMAGNRWSEARELAFPAVDDVSTVSVVDLLGTGTACLVWSTPLADGRRPLRYVDLMGGGPDATEGGKPHLLVEVRNNLGAETRIAYASSTAFYLADKAAGRPWITRLPFPVHVVERVETDDRISRNRFVTRYDYHHGFFDGTEREFRGFGMVEQWDTEELAALAGSPDFPSATNLDAASHVPPVHTMTWFHTGAFLGLDRVSRLFAGASGSVGEGGYYREPGLTDAEAAALAVPDSRLPEGLPPDEQREACRALKGTMLRQEVYADDGSAQQANPYTVVDQSFEVRVLQRRGANRHGVFLPHPLERLSLHYERDPTDPRVMHRLTLEVDGLGNVLKEVETCYGRRQPDLSLQQWDRDVQAGVPVTYTENVATDAVDVTGAYRVPLPSERRRYELTGYPRTGIGGRFRAEDFVERDPTDAEGLRRRLVVDVTIGFEQSPGMSRQARLLEESRTLYRADDLTGLLPLHGLGTLGLTGETYKLALTPGLLAQVFVRDGQALVPDPATMLARSGAGQGGYVDLDGDGRLWTPSGRVFLAPDPASLPAQELAEARQHFLVPRRFRDAFGADTTIDYDNYDLLPLERRDALGNTVTVGERDPAGGLVIAGNDYRVLQPSLVMDANRNRTAVVFDALGMVVGTAVMGKPDEPAGDTLIGFTPEVTEAVVLAHTTAPLDQPEAILAGASTRVLYDLFAHRRDGSAPTVYTLARETHDADLAPGAVSAMRHSLTYSDGFGREIQQKVLAEAGPVPQRDAGGAIVVGPDGLPVMTPTDVSPRWVGSGWVVFNNKGKPVRRYEPFFTDRSGFEFDARVGVSPVLFYDPAERVVGTLHPDRSWDKVRFTPWRHETWDQNDTVGVADPTTDADVGSFFARLPQADYSPTWFAARASGALGASEQAAAQQAAGQAATPTVAHLDGLGRTFLTVAHNRFDREGATVEETYATRVDLDIDGHHRAVRDAVTEAGDPRGRIVARYHYDLLGTRLLEASMEAGERWTLSDAAGKVLRAWDSRGHASRSVYDPLRRPVRTLVVGADADDPDAELLTNRIVYGEQHPDAEPRNLRGLPFLHVDQAGVRTNEAHDFKGNLVRTSRRTARQYRAALDWTVVDAALPADPTAILDLAALDATLAPLLDEGTLVTTTTVDALNRPSMMTSPDGSIVRHRYNEAGLLEAVDVQAPGLPGPWAPIVTDIDYDAKGRRERITYGNGVETTYDYEPRSLRLVAVHTTRGADALQDLAYVYDAVGNVTSIADGAQANVFFDNAVVTSDATYSYDAVYRLIGATGREHIGQHAQPTPWSWDDAGRVGLAHPQDGAAMRRYAERYDYDRVGNLVQLVHQATNGNWTRRCHYDEPSLLEPAKTSNRLSGSMIGGVAEPCVHDAHGNIVAMAHLPVLRWDCRDHLSATAAQVRQDGGTPETTYYVYDSAGARVRKVTDRQAAPGANRARRRDCIYVGGFEVRREYGADGAAVEFERQTVHVVDADQRVAMIERRTAGQVPGPALLTRYQLGNHLGSVTLELDGAAQVISYEEYSPYGSSSYQAVRSQTGAPKRYRYCAKERDEENGFSYHGARYYAPWLGRWTSCDPLHASTLGRGAGERGEALPDTANRTLINLYAYVAGKAITLVDPDGRQAVAPPIATTATASATSKPPPAVGPPPPPPPTATTGVAGFFATITGAIKKASDWLRDWMPGLIAAPLAGLVDIVGGFVQVIGGIFSGRGKDILGGLANMGLGALSMIGMKEFFTDKWIKPEVVGVHTTTLKMPRRMARDIKEASDVQESLAPDAWKNGMHAWHAATNAHIVNRLGPVGAPFLWIAGFIHESPIDWGSFKSEQAAQGTVNHILDSSTDLVANTWGILLGLVLPRKIAVQAAAKTGNYIPGPGDPDPAGLGLGGYTGNPADAWGQYP
jgi:RHS repeat-associated protein